MSAKKTKELSTLLDRLEAVYGRMVPTTDAVEAGLLALLAEHAPATFVDWNEMRVAEPWDLVVALEASDDPAARKFAKTALKYLRSLHNVLNRCSFERAAGEPEVDLSVLIGKIRGASAGAKGVCLAAATSSWVPNAEVSKLVQKLGLIAKTSSAVKAGKALEAIADPADHLRAHYLLSRYAARNKDDADPLGTGDSAKAKPSKKAALAPQDEPSADEATAPAKTDKSATSSKSAKPAKASSAKAGKPAKASDAASGSAAPVAAASKAKPAKATKAAKPSKATKAAKPATATKSAKAAKPKTAKAKAPAKSTKSAAKSPSKSRS